MGSAPGGLWLPGQRATAPAGMGKRAGIFLCQPAALCWLRWKKQVGMAGTGEGCDSWWWLLLCAHKSILEMESLSKLISWAIGTCGCVCLQGPPGSLGWGPLARLQLLGG